MSNIHAACETLCEALNNNYVKETNNNFKTFKVEEGRKYIKIVSVTGGDMKAMSAHAFVDKTTGFVFKPAGWNAPAKGFRFNIMDDLDLLVKIADWAGGYLYKHQ